MGNMTKNFSREEFTCQCGCAANNISPTLVDMLQLVRDYIGTGITITSGIRCAQHNAIVGGVVGSAHVPVDIGAGLYGHGVDIKVSTSQYRYKLTPTLYKAGFRRIGIGDGFIHVDIDTRKPQDVEFAYYKANHIA